MTMGSSELACTIESTTGKTKLFPEVNLFFDVCCRHWVTMLFSFEIALKSFVQPRQLWSSLKFKSRNHKNIFTFRSFTHVIVMSVMDLFVSITIRQKCISQRSLPQLLHLQCYNRFLKLKPSSKHIDHIKIWF